MNLNRCSKARPLGPKLELQGWAQGINGYDEWHGMDGLPEEKKSGVLGPTCLSLSLSPSLRVVVAGRHFKINGHVAAVRIIKNLDFHPGLKGRKKSCRGGSLSGGGGGGEG